jgi:hypothetical protein
VPLGCFDGHHSPSAGIYFWYRQEYHNHKGTHTNDANHNGQVPNNMQTRITNDGQYNRQADGKCKSNEIGIEKFSE